MNLTDDELKLEINNYILNKRVDYALLIDGEWGSGKTFFIKEKIIPDLKKKYEKEIKNKKINKKRKYEEVVNKQPLYISLYGIQSITEISNQIYFSIMNKSSKYISIGLDAIKFLKPEYNYTKINDILNEIYKLDSCLLIFDDLERTNLNINECLGYINNFVEHQKVKVIIIANEKEIGKKDSMSNQELKFMSCISNNVDYKDEKEKNILGNDKTNEKPDIKDIKKRLDKLYNVNTNYLTIKEKLIGKTLIYKPNINIVIDVFIKNHSKSTKYYSFLNTNKETFIQELNIFGCSNLRTIKYIIEDFFELYQKISCMKKSNVKDAVRLIFINYAIVIINLKAGEEPLKWNVDTTYDTMCFGIDQHQIISKYFLAFKFVDDYIINSKINMDLIKKTLDDYLKSNSEGYEFGDNSYSKLKTYWELEDNELKKLLVNLKKEISSNYYTCNFFPKIIVTLSYLQSLNFEIEIIDGIIEEMCGKILQSSDEINLCDHQIMRDEKSKRYYDNDIEKLKENVIINQNERNNSELSKILDNDNWGIEFYNYVEKNNGKFLNEKAFLANINIAKIMGCIKKTNSKNLYYFKYSLDKVYNFSNINEFYSIDKENLKELLDKISQLDQSKFGVTKKEAIEYLIAVINSKLDLLNK